MPPAKRQKLSPAEDDEMLDETHSLVDASASEDEADFGHDSAHSGEEGDESPDTEDEIENAKYTKSKKTLKRKHRATDSTRFGAALQSLLTTDTPSSNPLSLKPSISRKRNDEKLELKGKKVLLVERKEKEEMGRIRDVIGGWGGESERALRKVAQRGVVKLFNVIQQTQAASAAATDGLKALHGSGKPTLPAPRIDSKAKGKKSKQKDNLLGRKDKAVDLAQGDFLNSIRSGGVVSKV